MSSLVVRSPQLTFMNMLISPSKVNRSIFLSLTNPLACTQCSRTGQNCVFKTGYFLSFTQNLSYPDRRRFGTACENCQVGHRGCVWVDRDSAQGSTSVSNRSSSTIRLEQKSQGPNEMPIAQQMVETLLRLQNFLQPEATDNSPSEFSLIASEWAQNLSRLTATLEELGVVPVGTVSGGWTWGEVEMQRWNGCPTGDGRVEGRFVE